MDRVAGRDTIIVGGGIYSGSGWVNLSVPIGLSSEWGVGLTIIGEDGPNLTRIECGGQDFMRVDTARALTVRGISVTGAGTALKRDAHAALTAVNCVFDGNGTVVQDSPSWGHITIDSCRLIGNGTALSFVELETTWDIRRSLFRNNEVGFHCLQTNGADVYDNVFTGNTVALRIGQGAFDIGRNIIFSNGCGLWTQGTPQGAFFTCNDVFGNQADYVGVVPEQTGTNGNVSLDPEFCDTTAGFRMVASGSPCLAEYNECGQTIGYVVSGCPCCRLRGDITHSGDIAVSDLTALIAFLFRGGAALHCVQEADVDANDALGVADLTALVGFLFRGGAAPPPCEG
ncbi:MAG TPA: hypothetical protein PK186_07795 [candidate division Zixibacteria bacterium]|mgnify:CR=1 FL=1|nr:hypothetical protein [candidate division Zixibacteria bacterium]MDD4918038.1 hypothetical protein [candidate division Zixibacteria bacterium]MDM7974095.1 hypothetical protein [candidate division Zixibacteria bacterium]HPM37444.1 hypothetical protein [candidate division Zixibacteria bacterium]HQL24720.1 hypothetical protein [candidate division Zixibacteria bacterium]